MLDLTDDTAGLPDMTPAVEASKSDDTDTPEQDKALAAQILRTIKEDKKHHDKAFKRMRRDMQVAMWGAEENWSEDNYRANIVGRHVKMKTAALYAKNPKAVARRRDTLDFAVWDENPSSLQLAFQTVQQATQQLALAQQTGQPIQAAPGASDPTAGGQPGVVPIPTEGGVPPVAAPVAPPQVGYAPPQASEGHSDINYTERVLPQLPTALAPIQLPPGLDQAQAVIADFQQGIQRRNMLTKYSRTLEILFSQALREQKPLDFKRGMKQAVRRTITTGVGYVELGFQREYGPRPGLTEQLADARTRLDHLKNLTQELGEGGFGDGDAEMAELTYSVQQLQTEPEIVLREGLIVDFPQSTKVIPDRYCKQLDGFVGARHITIEYTYTTDEVKELFDVDLEDNYTNYTVNDGSTREISANSVMDDDYQWVSPSQKKKGLVCVWKYYDKPSGLVYLIADGYPGFLRKPAAPDVFVEDFWPVYALTFNAVESERELFPPSDVSLLLDMQREYNRSRQGMREHRKAARPRWAFANGAFADEEDPLMLKSLKPFEAVGLNIDPGAKIGDILQVIPVPGVDPNLYETNQLFTDMQLVGGAQESQYGGVSKSTATESAIAANSTSASDSSSIDDLDAFLTLLARSAGQILQKEMSEEKVGQIVGPGAVWPQVTLAEIASEIYLEVEAGSTGKPNQAVEINNWKQLLPMLMQMPGLNPLWLLKETLRRLDDRMDLTDAIAADIPSIISQNQQTQIGMPGQENPNMQGGKGGDNAPRPPGQSGSGPAFGSNQV
jgi:hypothetical protein